MKPFVSTFRKSLMVSGLVLAAAFGPALTSANAQTALTPPPAPTVPVKPATAQETYDANAIEQIMNVVAYFKLMRQSLEDMTAAIIESKDITKAALTGDKKAIPLFNTGAELDERTGPTLGLFETATAARTGGAVGSPEIIAAIDAFKKIYMLDEAFKHDPDVIEQSAKDEEVATQSLTATGLAAGAFAETGFTHANTSMARLDTYIKAIEDSPDLKTSVDLNTRVLVEIAQQNNENLRAMSALTSLAGTFFMANGYEAPPAP